MCSYFFWFQGPPPHPQGPPKHLPKINKFIIKFTILLNQLFTTLNYKNELPTAEECTNAKSFGTLLFALGLPRGTHRVKMSFPLGTCDKSSKHCKT